MSLSIGHVPLTGIQAKLKKLEINNDVLPTENVSEAGSYRKWLAGALHGITPGAASGSELHQYSVLGLPQQNSFQ